MRPSIPPAHPSRSFARSTKDGFAPIFAVAPPDGDLPVVLESELADAPAGKYTATLRTQAPGTIALEYDSKTMYASGVKLELKAKEGAEDALVATDDGKGTITFEVKKPGALFEVSLTRK